MNKKSSGSTWAAFFSGLCVLGALALLLVVCTKCYPNVHRKVQELFSGVDTGPVRQAFGVLAEGLEEGDPIRQTLRETVDTLFHEKG